LNALEGPSKGVTFRKQLAWILTSAVRMTRITLGSDESTLKAKDRKQGRQCCEETRLAKATGGLGRMKSIREVAQKRNDVGIRRGPSIVARVQETNASGIVRRKSTKMFGAHIVQIRPKPGNRSLNNLTLYHRKMSPPMTRRSDRQHSRSSAVSLLAKARMDVYTLA